MAEELKKGDRVEWDTSQGKTTGRVKKKLTEPTKIKGHRVEPSRENPEYLVESETTGAEAAHKPEALEKVKGQAAENDDARSVIAEFKDAVNMVPKVLESWLDTEESKEVGFKDDGEGESVGHQSGRRIVALLPTKRADDSDDDPAHMKKVVGYIRRHLAQRPEGDVSETRWRYSLMNRGHDPIK